MVNKKDGGRINISEEEVARLNSMKVTDMVFGDFKTFFILYRMTLANGIQELNDRLTKLETTVIQLADAINGSETRNRNQHGVTEKEIISIRQELDVIILALNMKSAEKKTQK